MSASVEKAESAAAAALAEKASVADQIKASEERLAQADEQVSKVHHPML